MPQRIAVLTRNEALRFKIKTARRLVVIIHQIPLPRSRHQIALTACTQVHPRDAMHGKIDLVPRLRDLLRLSTSAHANEISISQLPPRNAGGVKRTPLLRVRTSLRPLAPIRHFKRQIITAVAIDQYAETAR